MLKNKSRVERSLLTLYGMITYRRTLLVPIDEENRQKLIQIRQEKGIYPLDSFLGADRLPFKITIQMMAAIAKESVKSTSYQRATEAVQEHYGVCLSKDSIRCVTDYVGAIVYADDKRRAEAARISHSSPFDRRRRHRRSSDILYIEMDGAMLNTRIQTTGSSWMECKIGLAFLGDDMKSWKTRQGSIRREITKKRLVGYIGNCKNFKYHILALAEQYDYRYRAKIVVISDGADWIHRLVTDLFPEATHILDLCHVKERVSAYGKWLIEDGEEANAWIKRISSKIEEGEIDAVLTELEPHKDKKCPQNVLNLYTYISNHRASMNYKEYRQNGYFVGSGASESANKYTMQNRMKLQGMRWNVETGQGMLSLKARLESGCWHEVLPLLRNTLSE